MLNKYNNSPFSLPYWLAGMLILLALSGCGAEPKKDEVGFFSDKRILYKSSNVIGGLEVPPELDSNAIRDLLPIPEYSLSRVTSYSGYLQGGKKNNRLSKTVLPDFELMSIKSYNNKYWLVIQGDVEKLWEKIKKFWEKQGFDIAKEESAIGLIETNWLENKHQKEDDFIRNTLRKTLRFLDSSNIKDKYRSRLEVIKRDDQSNVTAIYITHRSTQERGQQSAVFGVENTSWIETTSDPELEIEMLYRLMVFIGGDAQDIKKKFSDKYYSTEKNDKNNELIEEGNELYLNVKESFYRSWRFTGIALDRIGVKIDDRDRKLGVYYINYKPEKPKKEKTLSGLFSFGDDDKKFEEASYLINIKRDDDKTRISVLDKSGKLLNNEVAKLLLKDIQKEL